MKLQMLAPCKKSYDQPRQHIKKHSHYLANKGLYSQSYGFSSSHVWMWELDHKAEHWRTDAFELWYWRRLLRVLGLQGDQTSQSLRKSVLNIHWKGWCWSWNSNTLATWWGELTHLKRPWCWERLKAGEGDDRRWDGWMASLTQWTWVWVNSGSWLWRGSLACCSPRDGKESDMPEWLNWTETLSGIIPGDSVVKNLPANAGNVGLIPGLGRSPG